MDKPQANQTDPSELQPEVIEDWAGYWEFCNANGIVPREY